MDIVLFAVAVDDLPEQQRAPVAELWYEVAELVAGVGHRHGFGAAREISHDGAKDLPWGIDSITGYSIINAESIDEAEEIARENPFIAGIRVYEVRSH